MDKASEDNAAGFTVIEKLVRRNRSYKLLNPEGMVVHSTATPGATDEAEQKYFDGADRKASAHYFVDWDSITQCVPENEEAWHAGKTANSRFLSVEMCEPKGHDEQKFQSVWNRTVWLVADACVRYGWEIDSVWSHNMVSEAWHESNHTDPTGYLRSYGKSFDQLKQAVQQEIAVLHESATGNASAVKNAVENAVDEEIVDNRENIIDLDNAINQETTAQHRNEPLENNPQSNPQNDLQNILQNYIRYRITIEMGEQPQNFQGLKNFENFEGFEKAIHNYLIEHFKIDYVLYGDGTSNLLTAICTEESMNQIKEAVEYCGGCVSIERV